MLTLIKTVVSKLARRSALANQAAGSLEAGEHPRLTDIAIDIGSFRLSLKDVATNEEAIARIEEFLKGQSASLRCDRGPRQGSW